MKYIILIFFLLPVTLFAQNAVTPQGNSHTLIINKGGFQVDSVLFIPHRSDSSWYGKYGDLRINTISGNLEFRKNGQWVNVQSGGGVSVGTVSSVSLSAPSSVFSVSGSPITTAGTLGISFKPQPKNTILAAPSGGTDTPSFRLLTTSDIPDLSTSKIVSGVFSPSLLGTGTPINGSYIDGGTGAWTPLPSIPTVNNGTLTLVVGAGLIGSATFTANQATNSTFTVGLKSATSNDIGGIKLYSDTTQQIAANNVSSITDRSYGIQSNSLGQAVVNVPWIAVSGTHPISVTNASTNSNISIAQANASTDGYLSSTDWNTFNNKTSLSNISATYPITYNSSTGVIGANTGSLIAGSNVTLTGITANRLIGTGDITINSAASGQLVLVTEGANTGWRLAGTATNKQIIGNNAIDLSSATNAGTYGAAGNNSFVAGINNYAYDNAQSSIALGTGAVANASNSATAIGSYVSATSDYALAMGSYTAASGSHAVSMGYGIVAPSYGETAIGIFNTTYTPASALTFNASDRLFTIGNGKPGANANALVMLKSGNTTLNGSLTINGDLHATRAVYKNYIAISSATYTIDTFENVLNFTYNGTATVTLPNAATMTDRELRFVASSSTTLKFTVTTGQILDFSNTSIAQIIGKALLVISDGTNWVQIGN